MKIVLPDGSQKELENGATVADVAASIGAGLAKAALGGIVNGQLVIEHNGKFYNALGAEVK